MKTLKRSAACSRKWVKDCTQSWSTLFKMIVTDGVGGLIQVFNLRFPSNLRRKIQFPFSYDYFRSQQVSGEEENVEQIGSRICFNSWQCQSGAKVQGSRLIHTCRAGARSCQLASNLCIQRHLNAVAVGGEEQEEPAQMVHCQSGSQSVTHYVPHSVSLYCWQFWRTFIFHRTKVSLSCKRGRERETGRVRRNGCQKPKRHETLYATLGNCLENWQIMLVSGTISFSAQVAPSRLSPFRLGEWEVP